MPAPLDPFADLARPFVLLEDRLAPGRPARLFADPVAEIRADRPDEVEPALVALDAARARGLHAAGFLAYELGYLFEPRLTPLLPQGRRLPLLWFGLFEAPLELPGRVLDEALARRDPPPPLADFAFAHDGAVHAEKVDRILDRIAAGDVYQVNLTVPIDVRFDGDPLALFAALRAGQPVAHGGLIALSDATILSVSPELFLRVEGDLAVTRPMKGTTARGATPEADEAARAALLADEKQRAENLMIVDLMRNDLARVAALGSVEVPELFRVETYPTLHTLTSTVTARLAPGTTTADLVRAIFPCGSITGAPKLMAMSIIRNLEARPRDVYTGAIGVFGPDGGIDLNVAIRTATLFSDGSSAWGVGGGIVADSVGANEWAEAKLKARVLTDLAEDWGLIETLRWSPEEGFVRLPRHLDRLAASAAALGFPLDLTRLRTDLDALILGADAPRRVRIELSRDGRTTLAAPPLAPLPDRPLRVGLARAPVDAGDPFLRHKTTKRARWDAASAEAEARGLDDLVFVNRDGFLTETTRANLFVERDGVLLTPAARHGLLPGVLRRELIETGRAVEADLRIADLDGARWFLGNSLRGMSPAIFA
ncbi:MAG: aminodeoxychorismate synthase component I [Hyphomicrobiales bacterium]|nr:aminodeoxychorismate synthase component I [Hyphomicrobiales bacterium]